MHLTENGGWKHGGLSFVQTRYAGTACAQMVCHSLPSMQDMSLLTYLTKAQLQWNQCRVNLSQLQSLRCCLLNSWMKHGKSSSTGGVNRDNYELYVLSLTCCASAAQDKSVLAENRCYVDMEHRTHGTYTSYQGRGSRSHRSELPTTVFGPTHK